jgi:hypothetical protein
MKTAKSASNSLKQKPIREEDSDYITTNYYIKIGLTRGEVKALTRLGKSWTNSTSPCATAARFLICLGLLNEDETESKLDALFHYIKAEGFRTLGVYCDDMMRLKRQSSK